MYLLSAPIIERNAGAKQLELKTEKFKKIKVKLELTPDLKVAVTYLKHIY